MSRILMRSGKGPFTPVPAETTLAQDVFNSNSGNFLFQHGLWRALAVDGTEIVSTSALSERRMPQEGDAARIDEEFDSFVIPLANAFRPEFMHHLERLTALVEQVTIPVTVVGVGTQAAHGAGLETLEAIAEPVRKFVAAVLERSASIGVRGQFTLDYLTGLGFPADAIDVIGCPSLFQWGPDFRVDKRVPAISDDSRLALNLTPEVPGAGVFATANAARHPDLVYVGQDAHDLRLLLWGTPHRQVRDPETPTHLHHRLYQEDRMRLFLDTWSWYDFLGTCDFAYGTRFHGNVAALLGGTPAMLLAHDSRTLELAEVHAMPHLVMPRLHDAPTAAELYERTDLAAFNAEMPRAHARYTAFLERNGLEHVWQEGRSVAAFDAERERVELPGPVRPLVAGDGGEVASRLEWLRGGMVLDITRHPQRYEPPFPHPPWAGTGTQYARSQARADDRHAAVKRRQDALEKKLAGLQERLESTTAELAKVRGRAAALERRTLRARLGRLARRLHLRR